MRGPRTRHTLEPFAWHSSHWLSRLVKRQLTRVSVWVAGCVVAELFLDGGAALHDTLRVVCCASTRVSPRWQGAAFGWQGAYFANMALIGSVVFLIGWICLVWQGAWWRSCSWKAIPFSPSPTSSPSAGLPAPLHPQQGCAIYIYIYIYINRFAKDNSNPSTQSPSRGQQYNPADNLAGISLSCSLSSSVSFSLSHTHTSCLSFSLSLSHTHPLRGCVCVSVCLCVCVRSHLSRRLSVWQAAVQPHRGTSLIRTRRGTSLIRTHRGTSLLRTHMGT